MESIGRRRWGGKAARIDKGEYVGSSREMRERERQKSGNTKRRAATVRRRQMVIIMVLTGNKFWAFSRELRCEGVSITL